jgi:hypothetical protein
LRALGAASAAAALPLSSSPTWRCLGANVEVGADTAAAE